jgi:ethanolamine ammonia-lyase small subunit
VGFAHTIRGERFLFPDPRDLISNAHPRGVSTESAAARVVALAEAMRHAGRSGVGLTETTFPQLPPR